MLNIGDASKIDEQEQALRRITSILAERPEKTLDPLRFNGVTFKGSAATYSTPLGSGRDGAP